MFELMKSEFFRYHKWAWLWALLLLGIIIYVGMQRPLLSNNPAFSALNNLTLFGGSFLFGLLQMALHKRKNHWTYLIHRPVKLTSVFSAIFIAGIGIIVIAAITPWILAIVSIDAFGSSIVDARHYQYPLFMLLTCIMIYQLGMLIVLNASWGAIFLAVLVIVLLAPTPNNAFTQYMPVIVFNCALFYLNLKSFKPDLSTHLKQPLAIALLSVPMSFTLALLVLFSTMIYYHVPKMVFGSHPDNNPQYGSLRYVNQFDTSDILDYYLENEDSELATQLKAQAKISDNMWLRSSKMRYPQRGQMHVYDRVDFFDDKVTKTFWQFSHDRMLFIGHHKITKQAAGVISKQGFYETESDVPSGALFTAVPYVIGSQQFMTDSAIFAVNFSEKSLNTVFSLSENEVFIDRPYMNDPISFRTNTRTIMFDKQDYQDEFSELTPLLSFPHVGPEINRRGIRAFKLASGLALIFSSDDFFGFEQPGAQVYLAAYDGSFTLVGERRFTEYSHPAWIRQFEFMVSPVLYYARDAIFTYLSPDDVNSGRVLSVKLGQYNHNIKIAAVLLHLLSLLALFFLKRFHSLSKAQLLTWVILVGIMGLPALLSFLFLNPFKGVYRVKMTTKAPLELNRT